MIDFSQLSGAGVSLPAFDREKMVSHTLERPVWVHFGCGNIFRAYIANLHQKLLEEGICESGITAAETFDFDLVDCILRPNDNMSLLVVLNGDGTIEKRVIASIGESLNASSAFDSDWARMKDVFASESLQMASLTITEKGYAVRENERPGEPVCAVAVIAALLFHRFTSGAHPIAIVSMDNLAHNGDVLKAAVLSVANAWEAEFAGMQGFTAWLAGPGVSFPVTMIDKITPNPSDDIARHLALEGISGMDVIRTSKGGAAAAFVNAEAAQYLVIEDDFPNGRPPLERAGVIFASRETAINSEKMKVGTCLNPLHTALAVFGCLLGFNKISDEMRDPDLSAFIEKLAKAECMPAVCDPVVINPAYFLNDVLKNRLPNPGLPDTPQRIAADTSLKMPVRFGGTIKFYMENAGRDPGELRLIPLVIAAWLRYLTGFDDCFNEMPLSPDPNLPELREALSSVRLGHPETAANAIGSIVCNESYFGVNLVNAGLADIVTRYFAQMISKPGAVREALRNVAE